MVMLTQRYASRMADEQLLFTPDTPNDYNREHAWTNDQAVHYNEAEYEAETLAPMGYQKLLGAWEKMFPKQLAIYLRKNIL